MRRLIFVCTANICRSQFMSHSFAEAIRHRSDVQLWDVKSRGTHVVEDAKVCELVTILAGEGGEQAASSQRPEPVTDQLIREQHLIIVATRAQRAEVAVLAPTMRSRAFTLREAVWLGDDAPSQEELDRGAHLVASGGHVLEAYASLLHWRRGLREGPKTRSRSRLGFGPPAHHPLDIDDGHGDGYRRHLATLRVVERYSHVFAGQVERFVDLLS